MARVVFEDDKKLGKRLAELLRLAFILGCGFGASFALVLVILREALL